jgi:hypothetical protein
MACKTKAARAQELADVVNKILDQDDDDPIPLAFAKMKVVNVEMLVDSTSAYVERMVFNEEDDFESDGTTPKYKVEDLPDGYKALLKIFITYVKYEKEVNGLNLRDDWSLLDPKRFNDYRFTQECSYRVMQFDNPNAPTSTGNRTVPGTQVVSSQAMKSMSADPHDIIRRDWKKGMKRDPSAFSAFTNDKAWENWHRGFVITVNVQMMSNILDPDYKPQDGSIDDTVFKLEQTYMYGVLNTVVQTSKGKEILRMHYKNRDAQKVYAELCLHYETSTAAVIDSTDTYQYLLTAKVNDWSGDTEKFIMHWFEQVRLYESTAETEAHLTDGQKMMLLINAVKDNRELAAVDTNFKTLLALDPTKKPSLEQYKALLLSAAGRYDRSTGKGTSRKNPVHY